MFEKIVTRRDTKLNKSSSKAESLAKEIERKMKDIDVTEGIYLSVIQQLNIVCVCVCVLQIYWPSILHRVIKSVPLYQYRHLKGTPDNNLTL